MIDIIRDNDSGEFYRISRNRLLVRWDNWELWKKTKDGWIKTEEVKRKDYQEYIKASNRDWDNQLIDVEEITYFTTLEKAEKISEKAREEIFLQQEKKDHELQQRIDLKNSLREVTRELQRIEVEGLPMEDIQKYQTYMNIILSNLKTGDIKDTKTTMEVNKNNRLELYKAKIDNYMKEGKYTSINKLCKDLGINRATFYNQKLNEYLKRLESY